MKSTDFRKLPKGTYAFDDVWRCKRPLQTPVGTFQVEFYMLYDRNPPDDKMFQLAEELVGYVQTHAEYIRDLIYGAYRSVITEDGPEYVETWGVPADLQPEQIRKYCDPTLVVDRKAPGDEGPPYEAYLIVSPKWEPEHNMSLEYCNGAIVTVNQMPFKFAKGVLKML